MTESTSKSDKLPWMLYSLLWKVSSTKCVGT